MDIKDKMLEGLDVIMKRGEKLDELQKKTADIKGLSRNLKGKSKKMNSWWSRFQCMGCGGATNYQRGAPKLSMSNMRVARKANNIKNEFNDL